METTVKRQNIILIIAVLLLSGYLFSQVATSSDYKIGPKDLLEISVFGLDELNQTVRVSENGTITLPLLGEIKVEGLSKGEVERILSTLLEKDYLQNPQVTVFIREYQSKRVSLLGAVKNPGPYEMLGKQSLLQIISKAGGLTENAGEEVIIIREMEDGTSRSLKISIEDLILKGDPTFNIPLLPNDIINIPMEEMIVIYVFGQVRNPGALQVKKSNIPTIIQIIAQAGGFAERASKGGVLIKRKDETGKEIQIKVNVKDIIRGKKKDIQLQENDIIYVPESIF
ncbi:MAG: polysaccharide biosynthesis/export family protein [Candidatus Aminicenantes bacterium]|nr:polysaccharide biosynthesis/export family protein [Candidatus Aminicenantes bacterium]